MRSSIFRIFMTLVLCAYCFGKEEEVQGIVSQRFPHAVSLEIACWTVAEEGQGYLSQIVIFQTDGQGRAKVLWQSTLEPAYSPQIRFIEDLRVGGLPVALVERQTGAASSQLDVIGGAAGRIYRLLRIEGFKFDVEHLSGSKIVFLIAHRDASILDVPAIYRWNGNSFVEDSVSHPDYYQRLLTEDRNKLPPSPSGIVLVNLSRLAVLSGNRTEARRILDDALSKERSKGSAANKETLKRIREALQAVSRHN